VVSLYKIWLKLVASVVRYESLNICMFGLKTLIVISKIFGGEVLTHKWIMGSDINETP